MPRRFRLLVFDWDGTLADSTALIVDAIRVACRDAGVRVPTADEARHVIGLGLADVLTRIAPGIADDQRARLIDGYRSHYMARDGTLALYAGTTELLAELEAAGYWLAVATGKSRAGLERALAAAGLAGRFHATRCADEGRPKPHPDMLLHLMRTTGVPAGDVLMIGDTTHDLDLAANAGVAALGIAHGAHDRAALLSRAPLAVLDSTQGLRDWLVAHG
ncbi:MAG: HAD-IA family hydrolase [Proteobacteria bacterium]|nr:HAD-IA family hydrolase [Pseudomonadota bacterium]